METLIIYYLEELPKVAENAPNQAIFHNILQNLGKDDFNRLFFVLNKYRMWNKFQFLAKIIIPIICTKIITNVQYIYFYMKFLGILI